MPSTPAMGALGHSAPESCSNRRLGRLSHCAARVVGQPPGVLTRMEADLTPNVSQEGAQLGEKSLPGICVRPWSPRQSPPNFCARGSRASTLRAMRSLHTVWIGMLIVGLGACGSSLDPAAQPEYTLVLLKTGAMSGQLSKEANTAAFQGHFANMSRLAQARQLLVAGPFGEKRSDPALRGIFVLDTADPLEAKSWAETDPTTQAGIFQLEYHRLRTGAPLRDALERALAKEAKAKAEGIPTKPGDGARPYVVMVADEAEAAHRTLTPLLGSGVFLLAEVDGRRTLALLDAQNVAEAESRFGPILSKMGPPRLYDWFAPDELAKLPGQ